MEKVKFELNKLGDNSEGKHIKKKSREKNRNLRMRAMDLVQWQSTFPTHERPGVRYPIPQKKREGGKKVQERGWG